MKRYYCKYLQCFGVLCVFIYFLHPGRHAKYYAYVPNEMIFEELVQNNHKHATFKVDHRTNLTFCTYNAFENEEIFEYKSIFLENYNHVQMGGEYLVTHCIPKYSSAVIVSYRNRPQQLEIFLKYMHSFLKRQQIHYRIFVAEQNNTKPFNRALMLNYGAIVAMTFDFSCLILHDVDLLPINTGNIYACSKLPRHMSCSIDVLRFNLPYDEIVGGVLAIRSEQFNMLNGMSTNYYGWGGEDDDFYRRMQSKNLQIIRFSPEISTYTMLYHKHEVPSVNRFALLDSANHRQSYDGLNSLEDKYDVKLTHLYTHIIVH